jgi:uncharacterized protein YfiM (DUF2279 family)
VRGCRSTQPRPRRAALALTLAVVALSAVAALVLAAGCGGQAATTRGVDHYANAGFHFSLDVDRRLTEWRSATAASGAAFEVAFVDAAGARAGGRHLDALTVSVVDTGTSPTSAEAAQLTASLRTLGAAMVAKMGSDAQAGDPSQVTVNGHAGVVVPFAVTVSGQRLVGWLYLFAAGGHIYALTASARSDHWSADSPLFVRAIDSFRIG